MSILQDHPASANGHSPALPTGAEGPPLAEANHLRLAKIRELVAMAVERLEQSKAFITQVDNTPFDEELKAGAEDLYHSDEACLAYQLERFIERLSPPDQPIDPDDWTDVFRPYGISHKGRVYVVTFDPGNMNRGIISTVETSRLAAL